MTCASLFSVLDLGSLAIDILHYYTKSIALYSYIDPRLLNVRRFPFRKKRHLNKLFRDYCWRACLRG